MFNVYVCEIALMTDGHDFERGDELYPMMATKTHVIVQSLKYQDLPPIYILASTFLVCFEQKTIAKEWEEAPQYITSGVR